LAVTRGDVAALNLNARERRREAGELGAEIRLAAGKAFAVGDRIMFEENARADLADRNQEGPRTVAIRNGTFATFVAVADQTQNSAATREGDAREDQGDVGGPTRHAAVVAELASGQRVTLTERYLEESTSLGYALTVFRPRAFTLDHSFLLADDTLFQQAGYTARSAGAGSPTNSSPSIRRIPAPRSRTEKRPLHAATLWPRSPIRFRTATSRSWHSKRS
jgi:hypothetical protein